MKCPCGADLELNKYTRDHHDGKGPKLVYECPEEECENNCYRVVRSHKPAKPITAQQARSNYFRHVLETAGDTDG